MNLGDYFAANEAKRRLRRAQSDLWWLMTEIGGIPTVPHLVGPKDGFKLSESFHRPMILAWDKQRRARAGGGGKDQLDLWSREFGKTTVLKWQTLQDYLCDPRSTVVWWHAVEEKAEEVCYWLSTQLQSNKDLRLLFPDGSLPSTGAKRFVSAKEFDLPANSSGHAPSFRAYGWSSEATGGHARYGKLDDIIARGTIEDNLLPKVRRWYQNTVCNVVEARGWKNAIGTRWDENDQYAVWLASDHWECRVRACLEKDGKPDKAGEPTYMDWALLKKKQEEMGPDFDPQMMNDPSPEGEKPWKSECERMLSKKEAESSIGTVVVITDPAPAKIGSSQLGIGSDYKGLGGAKDEWATCALKLRRVGDRREVILLDGESSKDWAVEEGFERMARMAYRYRARAAAIEDAGQSVALYDREWEAAKRKVGASCPRAELESTYRGKNQRFGLLCSRALAGEFLISEGCNPAFLQKFLDQARAWRPVGNRNLLREDGAADVVSYGCDPGLARYYTVVPVEIDWSPFMEKPKADPAGGSRWVKW